MILEKWVMDGDLDFIIQDPRLKWIIENKTEVASETEVWSFYCFLINSAENGEFQINTKI